MIRTYEKWEHGKIVTVVREYKEGDKDYVVPCQNCGELPTVHPTDLCGPCCFGEAETFGGNW